MTIVVVIGFLALNGLLGLSSARFATRFAEGHAEQIMLGLLLSAFWLVTASLLASMLGIYHLPGMACLMMPWLIASWHWGLTPRLHFSGALAEALIWLRFRPKMSIVLLPHIWFLIGNLRAMAAPPRAWDALVYHLPRAAFWVQDHGFSGREWPVQIEFYSYFAPAGDFLWAWTMLSGLGDGLLSLAYLVIWVWLAVCLLLLGREAGLDRERSALAMTAILSTPALLGAANAAYVDNLMLALLALMLVAMFLAVRRCSLPWLIAGGAAAALAACTKFSALPLLAPVLLLIGVRIRRMGLAACPSVWIAVGLTGLPIMLWMIWTLTQTGSLTYPFQLLGGQIPWLDGSAVLTSKHRLGDVWSTFVAQPDDTSRLIILMLAPLGVGHWSSVLLIWAIIGCRDRLKSWPLSVTMLAVIVAMLPVAGALMPDNRGMITSWIGVLGRHLLITLTLVVLVAARNKGFFTSLLLSIVVVDNLLLRLKFSGMVAAEIDLLLRVLLPAFMVLLPLAIVGFAVRQWLIAPVFVGVMATVLITTHVLVLMPLRDHFRSHFYRVLLNEQAFEVQPSRYLPFIKLVGVVNRKFSQRIVFSPIDDGALFYPLLGHRLQNQITLLSAASIDSSGRIDPAGNTETRSRFAARLEATPFDWAVLGDSLTAEPELVRQQGYLPALQSEPGVGLVYRGLSRQPTAAFGGE